MYNGFGMRRADGDDPALAATGASDPALDATGVGDPSLDATGAAPAPSAVGHRGKSFGHFLVVDRLGAGAMGVVLAAYDPKLDRKVALKVLNDAVAGSGNPDGRLRLLREAQAMARLAHPNVVTVFEVGETNDQVFVAMEFVNGGTLTQWLRKEARSRRDILQMFVAAGRGLVAAHAAGMIHRDFKPDNVLVGSDGRPRVSDFGLVGAHAGSPQTGDAVGTSGGRIADSLTATGAVMGTPIYMAPEQFEGADTDQRTDQFSYCVALYEALYGERPFHGTTYAELHASVAAGAVRDAPAGRDVPEWLRAVLLRGLRVAPADRFATMDELLAALLADPGTRARRRRIAVAVVSSLLAVGAASGYVVWRAGRVHTELCGNLVWRWQVPRCLTHVSDEAMHDREVTWRITSRRGRVLKLERLNSKGLPTDARWRVPPTDDDLGAVVDFEYGDGDRVRRIVARDQFGEFTRSVQLDAGLTRKEFRDRNGNPASMNLGVDEPTTVLLDLDDNGLVVEERYANAYGSPQPRFDRTFGTRFARDRRGLAVVATNLDEDGAPMVDRYGVQSVERDFDANGNVVEYRYRDEAGLPAVVGGGVVAERYRYDHNGNYVGVSSVDAAGRSGLGGCTSRENRLEGGLLVEEVCLDGDGKPTNDTSGYATLRHRYDARGDSIEASYLDANGQPVAGYDVPLTRMRRDDRRRVIETNRFDGTGQPMLGQDGWATERTAYDSEGRVSERAFFDTNGAPVPNQSGFAVTRFQYDERGNTARTAWFGPDGRPTISRDTQAAVLEQRTDERGHLVEIRYLGPDGKPVWTRDGGARRAFQYDEHGQQTEISYFDPEDNPAPLRATTIVTVRTRYDERGNRIEQSFHDATGHLARNEGGFAMERDQYDKRGQLIESAVFGIDGAPVAIRKGQDEGTSITRQRYDDRGHVVWVGFFDTQGHPAVSRAEGWSSTEMRYDPRGNLVEQSLYGADGGPILGSSRWARLTQVFDDRGHVIERSYFGIDGRPTRSADGVSTERSRYDVRGNWVSVEFLGVDGEPTFHRGGYAARRWVYDDRGRMIEQTSLDLDGLPVIDLELGVATTKIQYDALGHRIEQRYLGPEGAPLIGREGAATARWKYDALGRELEIAAFGVDDRPTAFPDGGFARRTRSYDAQGNEVELAAFGVDGKPLLSAVGPALVRKEYDAMGRQTGGACFGAEGEPLAFTGQNYVRWTATFDDAGNQVSGAYFGADGGPVLTTDGVASWRASFDASGHEIERVGFGLDGEPTTWAGDDYARITATYDSVGNQTEASYFAVDGRPVPGRSVMRMKYDPSGRMVESRYFGPDGAGIVFNGVAGVRLTFDERGRQTALINLGTDGAPAVGADGIAIVRDAYDERDNLVERRYFDLEDHPARHLTIGHAGRRMVYDDAGTELRRVGYDLAGEPLFGTQRGPDGHPFTWRIDGERFVTAQGELYAPVPGAYLDEAHMSRARAAITSFRAETRRLDDPALFDGARGLLVVAARAGAVTPGDILLRLDGKLLDRPSDLPASFAAAAKLLVLRNGAQTTLSLEAGDVGLVVEPQRNP